MKIAIICTETKEDITRYIDFLPKNLKITTKEICNKYDPEEKSSITYIEIETMKDLKDLKDRVQREIIITNNFYDNFFQLQEGLTLEIYDNYRE
jgi:hypothetical protein